MKSGIISVVTLVIIAWSSASVPAHPDSPGNVVLDPDARRNGWMFSFEEGKAQARKSAKPLMVVTENG